MLADFSGLIERGVPVKARGRRPSHLLLTLATGLRILRVAFSETLNFLVQVVSARAWTCLDQVGSPSFLVTLTSSVLWCFSDRRPSLRCHSDLQFLLPSSFV